MFPVHVKYVFLFWLSVVVLVVIIPSFKISINELIIIQNLSMVSIHIIINDRTKDV